MNILFISAGGSPSYTNTLTKVIYANQFNLSPNLIFFTFHPLTPLPPTHYYFFPAAKDSLLSTTDWNLQMQEKALSLISTFNIQTIIFEGHFVYSSLLKIMKVYPSLRYIWLKSSSAPIVSAHKREKYFDEVIVLSESLQELPQLLNALI